MCGTAIIAMKPPRNGSNRNKCFSCLHRFIEMMFHFPGQRGRGIAGFMEVVSTGKSNLQDCFALGSYSFDAQLLLTPFLIML